MTNILDTLRQEHPDPPPDKLQAIAKSLEARVGQEAIFWCYDAILHVAIVSASMDGEHVNIRFRLLSSPGFSEVVDGKGEDTVRVWRNIFGVYRRMWYYSSYGSSTTVMFLFDPDFIRETCQVAAAHPIGRGSARESTVFMTLACKAESVAMMFT